MPKQVQRCSWAGDDPAMRHYHDTEWGVPLHDDNMLFEFLVLEGAQAGLSWSTVLNKRDAYRRAFHGFDIKRVARMTDAALEKLLDNPAHHPQSPEDLFGAQQCASRAEGDRRIRQPRRVFLVVRQRQTDSQPA